MALLAFGDVATVPCFIPAQLPLHSFVVPFIASRLSCSHIVVADIIVDAVLLVLQALIDLVYPRVAGVRSDRGDLGAYGGRQ
jgi:hypothetical protein